MPTLQIRDFPQELYDQLTLLADNERRSLTQQAIYLLEQALEDKIKIKEKSQALDRFNGLRPFFKYISIEDVVATIREGRDS